jgi:Uma2 family endonuclease
MAQAIHDVAALTILSPRACYGPQMANVALRRATYEDVLAAPPEKVAEVIDGQLHLHPRPAKPHTAAASALGEELGPPFKRGRGGPGGWILVYEPEVHLGADIVVPDLGGWRRERMPVMTNELPYFDLAPDWVCEVLSDSTRKIDRTKKLPLYATSGVGHVWLVEPIARTLEVLRLQGDKYVIVSAFADDARLRAEPFDAFELDLAILWADVQL